MPTDQLLAARLHVLLRRPGDTLSQSSTNISQLLSTSTHSGIALVVRRPTSHNCVNFTHSAFPEKLETRLHCPPTCQAPEKDCNYPGLVHRIFVTHVSRLSSLVKSAHSVNPPSAGRTTHRHRIPGNRAGQDSNRLPPKETSVSLDTCATQLSRSLNSQAQGRWAIHSRTGERTEQRRKEMPATSGPGSPRDEKRHPPRAVVLQPPRDNE